MKTMILFLVIALVACSPKPDPAAPSPDKSAKTGDKTKPVPLSPNKPAKTGDKTKPAPPSPNKPAKTGDNAFMLSNPQRQANDPSVKVLSDGTVFAIWAEEATNENPAEIFAAVFNAKLPKEKRNRNALVHKISKLSSSGNSVVTPKMEPAYIDRDDNEQLYVPRQSAKLAVSSNGVAHVAWFEKNNDKKPSVYVSNYSPRKATWSKAKLINSTVEFNSEVELIALSNGDALLVWKQASDSDNDNRISLKAIHYKGNTETWGSGFELSDNVKPPHISADGIIERSHGIALFENNDNGKVVIGYLSPIDTKNDALNVISLNLSELHTITSLDDLKIDKVDTAGIKNNLSGFLSNRGQSVLTWADIDNGFVFHGAIKDGTVWQRFTRSEYYQYGFINGYDDEPLDVGKFYGASVWLDQIDNKTHIMISVSYRE